jgi:hypothetical protein
MVIPAFTAGNNGWRFGEILSDSTSVSYVKNFTVTQTAANGTVSNWYDQSTTSGVPNAKHAVQTSTGSQPKIVSGGTLVTATNGLPAMRVSGNTQSLVLSQNLSFSDFSAFYVVQHQAIGSSISWLGDSNGVDYLRYTRSAYQIRAQGAQTVFIDFDTTISSGDDYLLSAVRGSNTLKFFIDGSAQANTVSSSGIFHVQKLFQRGGNTTQTLNGYAQELILYPSDQTDNRTALEANIGEVYGIAGIPAYEDTVNGFVETWYDQSGNGNDATQLTAGSQPKIVDAGVYLGEVDFLDGTNTYLQTTNSDLCNVSELSVFSVLKPHTAQSQVVAFSCGSVVSGSTAYGGWRLNLNGYINQGQFQTQTIGNASATSLNNSVDGNDTLVSYVANFPDAAAFANGQAGGSTLSAISPNNHNTLRRRFRIGCQFTYQLAGFYTEPIKEIILYTSDQSANRLAIEANINNQYDIY